MIHSNPFAQAVYQAEKVLRDRGISSLPVNPFGIAKMEGIEIMAKPMSAAGVSGMLLHLNNMYGIAYATHIDNARFQRFSVAHELGHYFLPCHIDAVLGDSDIHESRAGFASGDQYELEADHFAANLLMPNQPFTAAMRSAGEGLDAIRHLSDICETSLTATAIRYAHCSQEPIAIVLSAGKRINFCVMSDSLKIGHGIDWIKKGEVVPQDSLTDEFNNDIKRVRKGERDIGRVNMQDWFSGRLQTDLCEEVIGLGSYGKTLTVLWDINLPDPDDEGNEDALIESWTPRFRR